MSTAGVGMAAAEATASRRVIVTAATLGRDHNMTFILWLIAVVLVIAGIVQIIRGGLLIGIVLIVVGLLVGPGGVSIFNR
jgi:hypothetical protein